VLQRAHDHEQLPRSEVVHRYGGSLFIGERVWFRKDLFLRHDHYVRITAEASQREDVAADPGMVHTNTHGVHQARDLVANDTGNLRRVRIQALGLALLALPPDARAPAYIPIAFASLRSNS
jgi:hypothetical protein